MPEPQHGRYFTVGVTGHIDHGKTTLVERLSGKNTDTHPEEQRRGITIDLGFAEFSLQDYRFALIDAPGHTRYIGNLLAGVARLDMAMLIVAADQGIEAQTVEHAAILRGMGVEHLLVVVTRTDLVATDALTELDEELLLFLSEVGFDDFPICHCSAMTGDGIDELQTELVRLAESTTRRSLDDGLSPRLPIDRVLRVEGRGWVAAGTLFAGQISMGDTLRLGRKGTPLRVRGIEQHGESVDRAIAGYRTAVNLVGDIDAIFRGDELLGPTGIQASTEFFAQITLFVDAKDLSLPAKVQLHTATTTVDAQLLGSQRSFRSGVVRIRTNEPVFVQNQQNILLRHSYPVGTLASGTVVADMDLLQRLRCPQRPSGWNAWRKERATNDSVTPETQLATRMAAQATTEDYVASILHYCGVLTESESQLAAFLGIEEAEYAKAWKALAKQDWTRKLGSKLVTRTLITWLGGRAESAVRRFCTGNSAVSPTQWMPQKGLEQAIATDSDDRIASEVVRQSIRDQRIVTAGPFVAPPESAERLTKNQSQLLEQLADAIDCPSPPTKKELAKASAVAVKEVEQLLKILQHQRRAYPIGADLYYSCDQMRRLASILFEWLLPSGQATVAQIRDKLGLTRKYAIPLLECFDKLRLTNRDGDTRSIVKDAPQRLMELF